MKKSKLIALLAICAMSATIAAGCNNPFASGTSSSENSTESSTALELSSSSSSSADESSSTGGGNESSSKGDESSSTGGGNESSSTGGGNESSSTGGNSSSTGGDSSSTGGGEQTDETISIAKANEIGAALEKNATTDAWYYVTGIIANVDDLNGTLTIKDGDYSVYAYKISNYATQETRLIVGDEITVRCQIQNYNGTKVELVNGEITASKDNTSAELPTEPAADSKLTIKEAIELSTALTIPTTNKYYVTGTISEIKSTKYGNLYIKDEEGNSLYVYGVYDENNNRYDKLENKPQVGDTITLYSAIYYYFDTPQMKNAVLSEEKADEPCVHQWGEWELVTEPTCTAEGQKVRYCELDNDHAEYASIAARGHDYGYVYDESKKSSFTDNSITYTYYQTEDVKCKRCGETAPYTKTAPAGTEYTDLTTCETTGSTETAGSAYNRYRPTEGYYTYTATNSRKTIVWIHVGVSEAGQYALHTLEGGDNTTITRHYGSVAYLNQNGGWDNATTADGQKLHVFNCPTSEYSTSWGAIFCLQITGKTTVKFCVEKIAEPAWEPATVVEKVYATQLGTEKAADGPEGAVLVEAALDANYVKGDDGYYHIGSKDGKILYVAINKAATRWFTDGTALTQVGSDSYKITFHLSDGYTADGDYKVYNYVPFLLNADPELFGGNPGACYQDFTNKDGVYPLNDELLLFLQRFAANEQKDENGWLALCYYYTTPQYGTENFPLPLESGDNAITIPEGESLYCTFPTGIYTVSCNTEGVVLKLDGKNYSAPFAITFDNNDTVSRVLQFFETDFNGIPATVTVTSTPGFTRLEDCDTIYDEETGNYYYDYCTAPPDEDGVVTISTKKIYTLNDEFEYYAYYVYYLTSGKGADVELLNYNKNDGDLFDIYGEQFVEGEDGKWTLSFTQAASDNASYVEIYVCTKAEATFQMKFTEKTSGSDTPVEDDTTLSFDTTNDSKQIKLNLTAGTYAIYALDDEFNTLPTVEFALSTEDEKRDRLTFTVAEDGEFTVYASWYAGDTETSCTCKYYLYALTDPMITETTGSAELVSGVFTPVTITMPTKGTYMLATTNSLTWSANMNGSTFSWDDTTGSTYTFTTTADNEAFTVYVKYDDLGNEKFTFDWTIQVIPEYTLTVGDTEATLYKGVRSPIHFTATEEGYYTLTATKANLSEDEDNPFYVSGYSNVYSFYAAANATVDLYVVYHYGEATETATLTLTKMALADASNLQLGENKLVATTEGTSVTFKAPADGWYAISDGWNGFLFFEDTEVDEYGTGDYNKVVQLAKDATITFTLKYIDFNYTGNTSELVTVTIEETEEPAPEIKLTVGENTITIYGEEVGAEVVLDSTFVNMTDYTFTWDNENVVIMYNYGTVVSGTAFRIGMMPQFSIYTTDGTTLENFVLTIDGEKASTGGDEDDDDDGTFTKFTLDDNELSGSDTFAFFSFTATEAGDYIFSTTTKVNILNAIYDYGDWCADNESAPYLEDKGSFTLTLTAGETVRLYLETLEMDDNYNYVSIDGIIINITKDGGSDDGDTSEDLDPNDELAGAKLNEELTVEGDPYNGGAFKFKAEAEGSYTLKTNSEIELFLAEKVTVRNHEVWQQKTFDNLLENGSYTFTLNAGETIYFFALMSDTEAEAFDCKITITKDGGSETPEPTPSEPTIPELTEIELDVEAVVENPENYMQSFKFTAKADGSYTLKTSAAIYLFFAKAELQRNKYYWVADSDYDYGDNEHLLENGEYTFTLKANETVNFYAEMSSSDAYEFKATITISEAVTLPECGVAYSLSSVNAGGALYFSGSIASGRINGSNDENKSVAIYFEATETVGEYHIYFMDGGTKTYIGGNAKTQPSTSDFQFLTDTPTDVWVVDIENKTISSKATGRVISTQAGSIYTNFSTYAASNMGTSSNNGIYTPAWFE